MTTVADLAAERYLLLTTFRRTGEPVATAVWVMPDADGLVIGTTAGTGKIKRLRHTSRVTLQACDMRGGPKAGAPVVEAVATVDDDPAAWPAVHQARLKKYGIQARLTDVMLKMRRSTGPQVAVRVRAA